MVEYPDAHAVANADRKDSWPPCSMAHSGVSLVSDQDTSNRESTNWMESTAGRVWNTSTK